MGVTSRANTSRTIAPAMRSSAAVAIALVAACGSRKPAPATTGAGDAGDAGATAVPGDAAIDAPPRAGTIPGYQVVALDDRTGGRLRVKVEWPTASAAMRRSPGRTACGGPRPPRARIGTLHGVAGAIVMVDTMGGREPPLAGPVRLVVRDCTIAPAVAIAPGLGGTVELQSQDEAPHHVTVTAIGEAWTAAPSPTPVAAAALPVIGHTVAVPLAEPGVLRVIADGDDGADLLGAKRDAAYVIAPAHPYVAATDDVGAADLGLLPPGSYPVRAFLPAAAGEAALTATATATIAAGQETDLTITFAAP